MKASAWLISSVVRWKQPERKESDDYKTDYINGKSLSAEAQLMVSKESEKQNGLIIQLSYDGDYCDIRQSPHRLLKVSYVFFF